MSKVIGTLVVIAGATFWLGGLGTPLRLRLASPTPSDEATTSKPNRSTDVNPSSRIHSFDTNIPSDLIASGGTVQITNWEHMIAEVLRLDGQPNEKAKRLLEMFPRFPEAGQVDAAQHIANLITDEDYEAYGSYFVNTNTPLKVQNVILGDLLGRPNSIKLPLLLLVARTPANAKANDAKGMLQLYIGKDYGENWQAWQKALTDWLKENPD